MDRKSSCRLVALTVLVLGLLAALGPAAELAAGSAHARWQPRPTTTAWQWQR